MINEKKAIADFPIMIKEYEKMMGFCDTIKRLKWFKPEFEHYISKRLFSSISSEMHLILPYRPINYKFKNIIKEYLKFNQSLRLPMEIQPMHRKITRVRDNHILTKTQWDKIRKEVYSKSGNICEICGNSEHKLHCHEYWHYDRKTSIQKLSLKALCESCHQLQHFELGRGSLNHFEKINNLSQYHSLNILFAKIKEWQLNSKKSWISDITVLAEYGIDIKKVQEKINHIIK